ncbi:hypothetical protein JAAARDRAFT_206459 [Jaapia argillacea MUCL 33604]|uniref:Thiaminase-2/PQQC domain-containing protein n=1 Tax=Jaapia argillacea MUCL 33604 TaxID=933084 RepID=A0A067Q7H9_9AGAM|nr:hypothetical protein JAAARDRAFT_206459 [Jaapia argillacea MUCL 33604]
MAAPKESLTSHLLSLSTPRPYSAAVEHNFLTAAGNGTLPHPRLALWLSQDRLYAAHAYPRFIGLLIAKIPFSSSDAPDSPAERRNERVLNILTYSLQNVVKEVGFFREASKELQLDIHGWRERKATRNYTAEMIRIASLGTLEEGLVFLWAMEKAYLDAWRYVETTLEKFTASHALDSTTTAISHFVSNWTSHEFVRFVDQLADLVNHLPIHHGSEKWKKAEVIWARLIEIEEEFWPEEGEEELMRLADPPTPTPA